MEEKYLVQKTWGDKSITIRIEDVREILEQLPEKNPTRRYFRIPKVEELQEVTFDVLERTIKT